MLQHFLLWPLIMQQLKEKSIERNCLTYLLCRWWKVHSINIHDGLLVIELFKKFFCCKCHTYTTHVYISFINVYEATSKENISWLKKSVPYIFVHMNKKALKTDGKSFKNTKRIWNMVWGKKIGSYFYMI